MMGGTPDVTGKANARSQARRGVLLGGLAARQAARSVGTRVAMVGRTEQARARLSERSTIRAAEQFVDVLGKLKGGAMKVGQILSVIDLGLLPEEHRAHFRVRLEKLCSQGAEAPFAAMREVIEGDLGPLDRLFATFDEAPIGVASIGQVYRAKLFDGREVAVKVQYPGIGAAIASDIRNLKLFGKILGAQWPGLRDGRIFDEIAQNLRAELDYQAEARTQTDVRAAFDGHPFFVIPAVIEELCTDRVLVTEYIRGTPIADARSLEQSERDRIGELIYRFYIGSLFERGEFSADPHVGNALLLPGSRLCFLDYGQYHRMDATVLAAELSILRAICDGDGDGARNLLTNAGVLEADSDITADDCLQFLRAATEWTVSDYPIRITPELVSATLVLAADPRDDDFAKFGRLQLPNEHLQSRRAELMAMSLVGMFEAECNWHRIAREWIYGDAPVTAAGQAIARWRSARA